MVLETHKRCLFSILLCKYGDLIRLLVISLQDSDIIPQLKLILNDLVRILKVQTKHCYRYI